MQNKTKKLLSILLTLVMLVGLLPMGQVVSADYEDGVYCEYCGAWRYDDWLCENGDHCAAGHGCGDEHHCIGCGECDTNCDWCEDCKMCVSCAMEYACHCWGCGVCGVESPLCDECGLCYDCGGECSEGTDHLCLECHLAEDMACPDCGQCYAVADPVKCLICGCCGLCASEWCDDCWMCIDCAMETHCHCPECGVCGVDSLLCDECGLCYDCGGECSEGTSHLCLKCHLAEDMACPDCGKCYAVGDENAQCEKCGACSDCATNYCEDCHMCEDCAIDAGTHCPDCGTCTKEKGCLICHRCLDCGGQCNSGCEDACLLCHYDYDQACPDCGNCFLEGNAEQCPECGRCAECGGGWCDNCGMCLDCAMNNDLHCPGCEACLFDVSAYCDSCHHCEDCADICPDCGEKCSECSVLCNNCGVCEDCTDICPVCGDYCEQCSDVCGACGACGENCADICPECENACTECSTICDDCGLCEDCCRDVSEAAGCEHGVCVMSSDWASHWEAEHAGQEHTHVYPSVYSTDADGHWKVCRICGEKADTGAHRENLTHVPAKEATCSDAGNKEYYVCACGMWFEDEDAQIEISDHKSVELSALGHRESNLNTVPGIAPTCTAPGRWGYGLCHDCGKCYAFIPGRGYVAEVTNMDDLIRPALGHDWSAWTETKAATTAEAGEETRTCSRCGEEETRSIPRLGVTSYEIIVNFNAGGDVTASAAYAEEGTPITINAVPDSGYVIGHITWMWPGGYEEYITDSPSFVMPAGNVTVDVAFEKAAAYAINMAVGANGNAVASAATSEEGKTITITAAPSSGYIVDEILLIPQSGYETDITEAGSFTMPACDVTIDVSFRESTVTPPVPGTHTVTFDGNGHGTPPAPVMVEHGHPVGCPADPTADPGWKFAGWCKDKEGTTAYEFSTPITGDITIYASWREESVTPPVPTTYTVFFDANGHGTAPAAQTVESGKTATKPATPTASGWTFKGWYKEAACNNAFNFSTPITDNITLYAKWTEDSGGEEPPVPTTYTVTFDANGHGTAPAAQTVEHGKPAAKPADPTASGWTFKGWYTEAACTNAYDFSTAVTGNITLYAKWAKDSGGEEPPVPTTYTVTFDANGHGTAPAAQTVEHGKPAAKPADPTASGWTFKGWYKEAACNNAFNFSTPITGNITLYAKWTAVSQNPFVDVWSTDYFYNAVLWAVGKGVTTGTAVNRFSPDMICTRAQMVTFLWRAAGSPAAAGTLPFTDVPADAYYYDAVLWAWTRGVTLGTSDTTFSPDMTVTRAQVVTLLYRYNGSPTVTGSLPFADVPANAYYYNAVRWAVANGITTGVSATAFRPDDGCTRAQIVTFLYRATK